MMGISKRLKGIIDFVPKNSIVGDIGTDHGHIPTYLIKYNISKKVIATDISKDCLQKAIDYIDELDYRKYIETRLGDGLKPFRPYEIDTLIIAGMGGVLIREILEEDKEKTKSITNFIFQPMTAGDELRKYLKENQFKIIKEGLIKEEDKFYEIIYAKQGLELIGDDIHLEIGEKLTDGKHPLLEDFLQYKINSTENIMNGLEGVNTNKAKNKYLELEKLNKKYKEVLTNVKGK